LTVRYDGSERTFAAGNDVVIGRDLRADVRVAHPLISRTHLIVRYDQGRWIALDNGSLNGLYVNSRRVPVIDIQDGLRVNVGNPDGPALSFEVGRHQGSAGRPPLTTSVPIVSVPSGSMVGAPQGPPTSTQRSAQPQPPASASFRHPVHPPTAAQPNPPSSGPVPSQPPSGATPSYPSGPQPRYPTSGPLAAPPSAPQPAPQIYRAPSMHAAPPTTAQPAASQTGRIGGDSSLIATSMM
jgi:predicted component of type VI protein secretion system